MQRHRHGIAPATMPRIGTVDERLQSFNVAMVEVIGGRFWKPYGTEVDALLQAQPSALRSGSTPVGMNPALFQARPPIDLTNPRLRTLAAALGPAYMRVSGTWATTTYFHDSDAAAPATPPEGFTGVLTRQQWRGVVDFAHAVQAKLVTSFATSAGTRDAAGVWTPAQARRFLAYTTSIGGSIAAAAYMNEPTVAAMGGAPRC
jgi:heparanase